MSRLLRLNLKCKFIGEALRRRVASDDGASAAGGHRVIPSASAGDFWLSPIWSGIGSLTTWMFFPVVGSGLWWFMTMANYGYG